MGLFTKFKNRWYLLTTVYHANWTPEEIPFSGYVAVGQMMVSCFFDVVAKGNNCCLLDAWDRSVLPSVNDSNFISPFKYWGFLCPCCTSFRLLWKRAQGCSHLSSEAALNEDFPFVWGLVCIDLNSRIDQRMQYLHFSSNLRSSSNIWAHCVCTHDISKTLSQCICCQSRIGETFRLQHSPCF